MNRSEKVLGRIKWFNNRLGYGFITYHSKSSGDEDDIFVHWSHLRIPDKEFHTLYKGEYVELPDFVKHPLYPLAINPEAKILAPYPPSFTSE